MTITIAPVATSFKEVLATTFTHGQTVFPRGIETREIQAATYVLQPYERFCNFPSRKLNLPYIKKEMLWYIKGDRFDQSITAHAKMWASLIQPDGGINSNYGQYIFNEDCPQFLRVVEILMNDKDSRRASIVILKSSQVLEDTSDEPCTYSINFSIRENKLVMQVNMRSQDAIFGMGNDAACFSMIHEMVFAMLRDVYPDLELGVYWHKADSLHIYSRHFAMVEDIINNDEPNVPIDQPKISSSAEVLFLLAGNFDVVPDEFQFTKFLLGV